RTFSNCLILHEYGEGTTFWPTPNRGPCQGDRRRIHRMERPVVAAACRDGSPGNGPHPDGQSQLARRLGQWPQRTHGARYLA
ncbi:MAG: hypothetical protein QGF12_00875, partial [SAR202 cluster bacterium]|nr:hypothetical protein [SAR202 cluster bacterium]